MDDELMLYGEFVNVMSQLSGIECWGVVTGPGGGTRIDLLLGDRVPRQRPLANTFVTEDVRRFDGAYALFVTCIWRLDGPQRVLLGCWEQDWSSGVMLPAWVSALPSRVVKSSITRPGLDLELTLANSLILKVFCDRTGDCAEGDNCSLFTPQRIYVVGASGRIRKESRDV